MLTSPIKGMACTAYIPMRQEPRHAAEMVSQIAFGECYTVLDSNENASFYLVENAYDGYKGWISSKEHYEISEAYFNEHLAGKHLLLASKGNQVEGPFGCTLLGKGSLLPFYRSGKIRIENKWYKLKKEEDSKKSWKKFALEMLNTPYLWGGRTSSGIDCSGLTQLVMRYQSKILKRDCSEQILQGEAIELEELKAGDLVFFSSIGSTKVSHVGIMLNKTEILHASGRVRIDAIVNQQFTSINGDLAYHILGARRY